MRIVNVARGAWLSRIVHRWGLGRRLLRDVPVSFCSLFLVADKSFCAGRAKLEFFLEHPCTTVLTGFESSRTCDAYWRGGEPCLSSLTESSSFMRLLPLRRSLLMVRWRVSRLHWDRDGAYRWMRC